MVFVLVLVITLVSVPVRAIQYSHNVCCVRSSSENHVLCTDSSLGHLLLLKISISEEPYQFRDGRDDAEDDEPNGVDASKNINSQRFRTNYFDSLITLGKYMTSYM